MLYTRRPWLNTEPRPRLALTLRCGRELDAKRTTAETAGCRWSIASSWDSQDGRLVSQKDGWQQLQTASLFDRLYRCRRNRATDKKPVYIFCNENLYREEKQNKQCDKKQRS